MNGMQIGSLIVMGRTSFSTISMNFIICSGVILGSAKEYLRFVMYMIERPEWTRCWSESMDHPIVNFLVYSGLLNDYKLFSCNDNVLNMQWCFLENRL